MTDSPFEMLGSIDLNAGDGMTAIEVAQITRNREVFTSPLDVECPTCKSEVDQWCHTVRSWSVTPPHWTRIHKMLDLRISQLTAERDRYQEELEAWKAFATRVVCRALDGES